MKNTRGSGLTRSVTVLGFCCLFVVPARANPTKFEILPHPKIIKRGEVFNLSVRLTGAFTFHGSSVYVSFDPAFLQVWDTQRNLPATSATQESWLDIGLQNEVDNKAGLIKFSSGVLLPAGTSGSGDVFTITFRAMQLGNTTVTFDTQDPFSRLTALYNAGATLPITVVTGSLVGPLRVEITPQTVTLEPNQTTTFSAVIKNPLDEIISSSITWSAQTGSITSTGEFTAPSTAISYKTLSSMWDKTEEGGLTANVTKDRRLTLSGTGAGNLTTQIPAGGLTFLKLNVTTQGTPFLEADIRCEKGDAGMGVLVPGNPQGPTLGLFGCGKGKLGYFVRYDGGELTEERILIDKPFDGQFHHYKAEFTPTRVFLFFDYSSQPVASISLLPPGFDLLLGSLPPEFQLPDLAFPLFVGGKVNSVGNELRAQIDNVRYEDKTQTLIDTFDGGRLLTASQSTDAEVRGTATVFVIEKNAPSQVQNLFAQEDTNLPKVFLSWDSATDDTDISFYRIYRSASSFTQETKDQAEVLKEVEAPQMTFTDITATTFGQTYYYAVSAVDVFDNEGALSEVKSITITQKDTEPPSTITDLKVTLTHPSVTLTWTPPTDNAGIQKIILLRSNQLITLENAESAQILSDTLSATQTEFQDTTISENTTYFYAIKALDPSGNFSFSNSPSVFVPDLTPPSAIFDLVAQAGLSPKISLSWSASSDAGGIDHYTVYQDTSPITRLSEAPVVMEDDFNDGVLDTDTRWKDPVIFEPTLSLQESGGQLLFSGRGATPIGLFSKPTFDSSQITTWESTLDLSGSESGAFAFWGLMNPSNIFKEPMAGVFVFRLGTGALVLTPASSSSVRTLLSPRVSLRMTYRTGIFEVFLDEGFGFEPFVTFSRTLPVGYPLLAVLAGSSEIGATTTQRPLLDLRLDNVVITQGEETPRTPLATVPSSQLSFDDTTGDPGRRYYYVVTATDTAENQSALSNLVSSVPNFPAISDLSVQKVKDGVQLSWTKPSDLFSPSHYRIYRSTSPITEDTKEQAELLHDGLPGDETTFLDNTGNGDTSYFYAITSFTSIGGESQLSNLAEFIFPDIIPPTKVINFTAESLSPTDAKLTWTPSTDNVAVSHYNLYHDTEPLTPARIRGEKIIFTEPFDGNTLDTSRWGILQQSPGMNIVVRNGRLEISGASSAGEEASAGILSATTFSTDQPIAFAFDHSFQAPDQQALAILGSLNPMVGFGAGFMIANFGGHIRPQVLLQEGSAFTQHLLDKELQLGTTHRYTILYDNSKVKFFIDGELQCFGENDCEKTLTLTNPFLQLGVSTTHRVDLATFDNVIVTRFESPMTPRAVVTHPGTDFTDTNLDPHFTHYYVAEAVDTSENKAVLSDLVSVFKDAEPPAKITGLVGEPLSRTSGKLTWDAGTDNIGVTQYRIYRSGLAQTLFEDTFSGTALNETKWVNPIIPEGMQLVIQNGRLEISGQRTEIGDPLFLLSAVSFSPDSTFTLSLDHSFLGSENASIGFFGGMASDPSTPSVLFFVGNSSVVPAYNAGAGTVAAGNPLPIVPGSTHTYTIHYDQGNVTWKVDGTVRATQALTLFSQRVFLAVNIFDLSARIDLATYDNIRVFKPAAGLSLLATVDAPTITHTDTTGTAGATFEYQVSALDGAGNEGERSESVFITFLPPDTEPPTAPQNLTAQPLASPNVKLTWQPSTDNEGIDHYTLFRKEPGTLLFEDTFSEATLDPDKWFGTTPPEGLTYQLGDGKLHISGAKDVSTPPVFLLSKESFSTDTPLVLETEHSFQGTEGAFGLFGSTDLQTQTIPIIFFVSNTSVQAATGTQTGTGFEPVGTPKSITQGSLHRYKIRIENGTVTWFVDQEVIAVTTGLTLVNQSVSLGVAKPDPQAEILLASFDNVRVVRPGVGQTVKTLGKVFHPTTTFVDSTGIPGTAYTYQVSAVDTNGNESPRSNEAQITVPFPDTEPPSRITDLQAQLVAPTTVELTWSQAQDNVGVEKYHIYRGEGSFTEEVLFFEDFSANTLDPNRWVIANQAPGIQIGVHNERLEITGTVSQSDLQGPPPALVLTSQPLPSDKPLSIEVDHSFVGNEISFGLLEAFTFTPPQGGLFLVGNNTVLAVVFGAEPTPPVAVKQIEPGTLHRYRITQQGSTLTWFVDGEEVYTRRLSLDAPRVALGVSGTGQGDLSVQLATFDNIKVTTSTLSVLTQIAEVTHPAAQYQDTTGVPGTTYTYAVTAVDISGNESPQSDFASVTLPGPDTEPPSRMTDLVAQAMETPNIKLTWSQATDNVAVETYNVLRGEGTFAEDVLFFEDFTTNTLNTNRWTILSQAPGMNITVQNERLEMTGTATLSPEDPPPALVVSNEVLPSDKLLSIDVDHSFLGNEFAFGLLGGLELTETAPPSGGVFIVLNNTVLAAAFSGGEPQPVPVKQIEPGSLHHYRIAKVENTFTWFVDGEQVYTQEIQVSAPRIALGIASQGGGEVSVSLATFDNIKVTTSVPVQLTKIAEVLHPTTTYTDATGIPGRTYTYAVTAVDTAGNAGPQSNLAVATVAQDTVPPSIFNPFPADGSTLADATPVISVQLSDDRSGIDVSTIQFVLDGRTLTQQEFIFDALTGTLSHAVPITQALSAGMHTVFLNVKDNEGNSAPQFTFSFILDATGPDMTILAPDTPVDSNPGEFSWSVTDPSGVSSVEVLVDGITVSAEVSGSAPVPNELRSHTISVRAFDTVGNYSTTSKSVQMTDDDMEAPEVTLVYEGNNTDGNAGQWSITVSDPESAATFNVIVDGGSVKKFNEGTAAVPVPNTLGTHTLAVHASNNDKDRPTDNISDEEVTTKTDAQTVADDDITAPVLSDLSVSPVLVKDGTSVEISAKAADPESSVAEVFVDATSIGGSAKEVLALTNLSAVPAQAGGVYKKVITVNTSGFNGFKDIKVQATNADADREGDAETSDPVSLTLKIDNTAPTTTLTPSAPLINSEFAPTSTTYTLSAVDAVVGGVSSGVAKTEFKIDSGVFQTYTTAISLTEGVHTISYRSTDNVGNIEATQTFTVKVDATAPITTITPSAPLFNNEFAPLSTTYSLSANDPVSNGVSSGVAKTEYRVDGGAFITWTGSAITLTEGIHTIEYRSTDNVGNVETLRSFTVKVDATAPISDATVQGVEFAANGKTYISTSTSILLTATDPISNGVASGVARTEFRMDTGNWQLATGSFTLPEGIHTVTFRSIDNVGNTETEKSRTYHVDGTTPTTTASVGNPQCTLNGKLTVGGNTPITLSAADPEVASVSSGVKRTEYRLNGGNFVTYSSPFTISGVPDGQVTIEYRSVDNVGNTEQLKTLIVVLDTTPPTAQILSPVDLTVVNGSVALTGTCSGFDLSAVPAQAGTGTWTLEFGQGSSFTTIKTSTDTITESTLATWDTTALQNGSYTLRLTAVDCIGNQAQTQITLIVGSPTFSAALSDNFNKPEGVFYQKAESSGQSADKLYVADRDNNEVKTYELKANSWQLTATLSGFNKPADVVVDAQNNVYVVDRNNDRIAIFEPTVNSYQLKAEIAGLNKPEAVFVDAQGNVYVADRNNNRIAIFELTANSYQLKAELTGFDHPEGVAYKKFEVGSGKLEGEWLYVSDTGLNQVKVFKLTANSWQLTATLTGFNNPGGLYVTNKGYLYVVSQNDEKIYKYDSYLNLLMTFGSQGNNDGQFNKPKDIAVKECADFSCAEELYIADRNHDKVQKFIYSSIGGKLKTLEKHLTPPLALGDVFTYPNPFSPNGDGNLDTTQIHYVLSQPADVTIRIYNVVGKLVKTFDTRFSGSAGGIAGENEVTWDGKNDLGRIVANGVYILHIEAQAGDERVEGMKKFSVLK